MRISDLFKLCISNLWKRKVRTLLTVLGVVIGTSSIVVMISLGVGLEESQREMISQWMDITTIEVYGNGGGVRMSVKGGVESQGSVLNEKMVEQFRALPNVVAATPVLRMYADDPEWSEVVMTSGRYSYSGSLIGMDLTMLESLGYKLKEGRWPTLLDENVILFGENAAYNFVDKNSSNPYPMVPEPDANGVRKAPKVNPMTGRIYIRPGFRSTDENGNPIVAPKEIKDYKIATTGVVAGDYQKDYGESFNAAYIDYRLVVKLREDYYKLNNIKASTNNGFDNVRIKVNDMKNVAAVEKAIQDQGFSTYSFEQIRSQMEDQMRNIQLVLGALGAVSMLVAALGIANTMVMSIYERTREIGVMKVIGCKLRDIRSMFLVEAGTIGLLGGVVGLALSYGLSYLVNKVVGSSMFGGGKVSVIPIWLVVLGFSFSILVGVISGLYPAQRAVKISALAAIRQD